jgi:hypothetical protein
MHENDAANQQNTHQIDTGGNVLVNIQTSYPFWATPPVVTVSIRAALARSPKTRITVSLEQNVAVQRKEKYLSDHRGTGLPPVHASATCARTEIRCDIGRKAQFRVAVQKMIFGKNNL